MNQLALSEQPETKPETEQGKPLFSLKDVSRSWGGNDALKGITLDIRAGEVILLAGPSGSGKSTLLRILTGALKPTSGRFEVGGVDLSSMSPSELRKYKRTCGIVEQGNLLVPQLDVHRNVLAGRLAHWPWHRILLSALWPIERERVATLLADLGLSDRQWETTANLSGGQQQRVAVARAMISAPMIIIADEPTASLDSQNAIQVTQMMVNAAKRTGATLILCTHWISLALPYMERLIGLRDGAIAIDCHARDYDGKHEGKGGEFVDEDSLISLFEGSLERQ
ncbi:MAG: ATP-binding cassette domain-containing protein [Deltaproteobacteria bacterium]|nr:ATP-binding cassette domain-containing protein [Deltaproteobacteria bacterium]MDQ3297701.1 ATP-binding cassette domain-containing protein [Myxococcota bacterium]